MYSLVLMSGGYYKLLDELGDAAHAPYEEMTYWIGSFDPDQCIADHLIQRLGAR